MAIMEKDDNVEIEIIPLSNLDGQGCGHTKGVAPSIGNKWGDGVDGGERVRRAESGVRPGARVLAVGRCSGLARIMG